MGCARILLGIVNIFLFLYSLTYLIIITLLRKVSPSKCLEDSGRLHVYIAAIIMVIAILGIIGACCNSKCIQSIYDSIALIATICIAILLIWMVTTFPRESPEKLYVKSEKTPNGNWYDMYSPFVKKAFVDNKDWFPIQTCLVTTDFCSRMNDVSARLKTAVSKKYRYPQLGCCFAPSRCGLLRNNATGGYEVSKTGLASKDADCLAWSISKTGNCYSCESCKAGFIARDHDQWLTDRGLYIGVNFLLFVASLLTCCIARKR